MNALATFLQGTGPRLFPVLGDYMEPTVRRDDFLLVVPVGQYLGEGIYVVLDAFGEPVPHRVQFEGPRGIHLWGDNPRYSGHYLSREEFRQHVVGKAIGTVNMIDRLLAFEAMRAGPVAATARRAS